MKIWLDRADVFNKTSLSLKVFGSHFTVKSSVCMQLDRQLTPATFDWDGDLWSETFCRLVSVDIVMGLTEH